MGGGDGLGGGPFIIPVTKIKNIQIPYLTNVVIMYFFIEFLKLYTSFLLCKVKGQYLLISKVSRYCLLALHGSIVNLFNGE